jgi:hypothetical protein
MLRRELVVLLTAGADKENPLRSFIEEQKNHLQIHGGGGGWETPRTLLRCGRAKDPSIIDAYRSLDITPSHILMHFRVQAMREAAEKKKKYEILRCSAHPLRTRPAAHAAGATNRPPAHSCR